MAYNIGNVFGLTTNHGIDGRGSDLAIAVIVHSGEKGFVYEAYQVDGKGRLKVISNEHILTNNSAVPERDERGPTGQLYRTLMKLSDEEFERAKTALEKERTLGLSNQITFGVRKLSKAQMLEKQYGIKNLERG